MILERLRIAERCEPADALLLAAQERFVAEGSEMPEVVLLGNPRLLLLGSSTGSAEFFAPVDKGVHLDAGFLGSRWEPSLRVAGRVQGALRLLLGSSREIASGPVALQVEKPCQDLTLIDDSSRSGGTLLIQTVERISRRVTIVCRGEWGKGASVTVSIRDHGQVRIISREPIAWVVLPCPGGVIIELDPGIEPAVVERIRARHRTGEILARTTERYGLRHSP